MFLHLGSDRMIESSEVVAVFDLRLAGAESVKKYIEEEGRRYEVIDLAEAPAERASCILTKTILYLSPISAATLKKRAEKFFRKEDILLSFRRRKKAKR